MTAAIKPTAWWGRVRVYGTWITPEGEMIAGKVTAKLSTRLTSKTDRVIIPAGGLALQTDLNTTDASKPSLDIMLPATDDPDIDQAGTFAIVLTVALLPPYAAEPFTLSVIPLANRPTADGGNGVGIDLSAVIQAAPGGKVSGNTYSVGTPGGVALLSLDGLSVLNAAGQPITAAAGATGDAITTTLTTTDLALTAPVAA